MLNINIFENIDLTFFCASCFGRKKKNKDLDCKIIGKDYKISILPITPNFDIDNLYPISDHVELWNIFIIGNDKTYILANVNDPHIVIPGSSNLINKQGQNILPKELYDIFDNIWTRTLTGRQMQFYMVWNTRLYFMNTYPFLNNKGKVIGAILFMRNFENIPEKNNDPIIGMPTKKSMEVESPIHRPK